MASRYLSSLGVITALMTRVMRFSAVPAFVAGVLMSSTLARISHSGIEKGLPVVA